MISETTKRINQRERQILKTRIDRNAADAEGMENHAARLRDANAAIAKDIAALKKDIPDPTPQDERAAGR